MSKPGRKPHTPEEKKAAKKRKNERRKQKRRENRALKEQNKELGVYQDLVAATNAPAGTTNTKASSVARDGVMKAFNALGGEAGLVKFAKENPKEFYVNIWGKLLPKENTLDVGESLEDLLGQLGTPAPKVIEGEYTDVESDS